MKPNARFAKLADDVSLEKTVAALEAHGMTAMVVENGHAAKQKVLELILEGAEVFTMSSETLAQIGLAAAVNESGKYDSVRKKLMAMDIKTQGAEMRKLGAAPDYAVGSVQAVTEDGHVFIASNTGSQLGAYAYGAAHVIWVVGAQKVVKDDTEALWRIHEYVFPLEDERAQKAYGMHSGVNKILIINKEIMPKRATVILVKEKLGF
ncbi:MAG: LUD domain-containing protein [Candidatus Kerfeldbacteria bacterium]|nr:LUD domain-containing protein [Candidatus Kerfeldbacteria bacterium]